MDDKIRDQKSLPTVLLAFDGSIQSLVAAFLLQKQGYQVSVLMMEFWNDDLFTPLQCPGPLRLKAQDIKPLCDRLEVKLYAVNASGIYQESILSSMVASRLLGYDYCEIFHFNSIILALLEEKRKLLDMDFMATGHLAKVAINRQTGHYSIMRSLDSENDQSAYLAGVARWQLEHLILPLSEIKKRDVYSIAEKFQLPCDEKWNQKYEPLFYSKKMNEYLEKNIPEDLKKEGPVLNIDSDVLYGTHSGFYPFVRGQNNLASAGLHDSIDQRWRVVDMDFKTYSLKVGAKSPPVSNACIIHCLPGSFRLFLEPIEVEALNLLTGSRFRCSLYFKSLQAMMVKIVDPPQKLTLGATLVFYQKTSRTDRLIGSGEIRKLCDGSGWERFADMKTDEQLEDREKLLDSSFYF